MKMKGSFHQDDQKVILIKHHTFYKVLLTNKMMLKTLVKNIAEALVFLSSKNIVHGDLKPDNICIEFNKEKTGVQNAMLVDFGSSFVFEQRSVDITTDSIEYCSPEAIIYLQ